VTIDRGDEKERQKSEPQNRELIGNRENPRLHVGKF
jgi:hypothetical protein